MYNETIRRQKFSESRRNNAKSTKNQSTSKAYAQHMETETENETITINRTKAEILDAKFEDWWLWYDYKKSKEKAKKSWNTLTEQEKDLALQTVQNYVQSTPDKTFRKHPTTYLNQKCFNDEIITRNTTSQSRISPKITDEQLHEAFIKRSSSWQ